MTIPPDPEILSETETAGGWAFEAQWIDAASDLRYTLIRLSWADYNLWSPDGSAEPQAVAAAALRFQLQRSTDQTVPATFDAASLRRRFEDADREIPALIR